METILSEDGLPRIQARRAETLPLTKNGTLREEPPDYNLHRTYLSATSLPQSTMLHPSGPDQGSQKSSPSQRSNRSSPTPQYLSPNLTDSGGETSPYKPGPDDTISLDQHSKHKEKKKKLKTPLVEGIQKVPARTKSQRHSPLDANEEADKDPSPLPILSWKNHNEDWRKTELRRQSTSLAQESEVGELLTKLPSEEYMGGQVDTTVTVKDSSYTTRLERVARALERKRRRRYSLEPPPVTATTAVVALESDGLPILKSSSGRSSSGAPPKATVHQKERAYQMSSQRRASETLETPATITLRRATLIQKLMTEVSPNAEAGKALSGVADTTSSQKICQIDTSDVSPESSPGPLNAQSPVVKSSAPYISPKLLTKVKTGETKRSSMPAHPALTFVEVSTAPSTFSFIRESRKSSQSISNSSRRTSKALIQSDNSVHEIIWDHDDPSSSRSSTGDPLHKNGSSLSSDAGVKNVESQTLEGLGRKTSTPQRTSPKDLVTARPESFPDVISVDDQPIFSQDPLPVSHTVSWAWNSNDELPAKPKQRRKSKYPSRHASQSAASRNRGSRSPPPTMAPFSVESFPPLVERQTTADWIKPLGDLNESSPTVPNEIPPKSVQQAGVQTQRRSLGETITTLEDVVEVESPPLGISSNANKAGSAIGNSSHVRKASVVGHRHPTTMRFSIPDGSSNGPVVARRSSSAQLKAIFVDPLVSLPSKRESKSTESIPASVQIQADDVDRLTVASAALTFRSSVTTVADKPSEDQTGWKLWNPLRRQSGSPSPPEKLIRVRFEDSER